MGPGESSGLKGRFGKATINGGDGNAILVLICKELPMSTSLVMLLRPRTPLFLKFYYHPLTLDNRNGTL